MSNNTSIYKHPRIDPCLWYMTILWIIEQVEAIDFDEVGEVTERPLYLFVESEVEA